MSAIALSNGASWMRLCARLLRPVLYAGEHEQRAREVDEARAHALDMLEEAVALLGASFAPDWSTSIAADDRGDWRLQLVRGVRDEVPLCALTPLALGQSSNTMTTATIASPLRTGTTSSSSSIGVPSRASATRSDSVGSPVSSTRASGH